MKLNGILLLLLIPLMGLSQTYQKTLKPGKSWEVCEPIGMGVTSTTPYVTICDTIINSTQYYNVYQYSGSPSSNLFLLQGFVREDSLTQKLYFLDTNSVNEKLIVDYTLVVGDSFNYRGNMYGVVLVDTMSTVLGPRKTIHFDGYGFGNPYLRFIEGQGNGFWGVAKNHDGWGMEAVCGTNDNSGVSCGNVLPIDNIIKKEQSIQVYPNPFNESISIELDYNKGITNHIGNIYDLTGKRVATFDIQKQKNIQVNHLSLGVYFLRIEGFKSIKLIKQN
jgi:hypothetical protein